MHNSGYGSQSYGSNVGYNGMSSMHPMSGPQNVYSSSGSSSSMGGQGQ